MSYDKNNKIESIADSLVKLKVHMEDLNNSMSHMMDIPHIEIERKDTMFSNTYLDPQDEEVELDNTPADVQRAEEEFDNVGLQDGKIDSPMRERASNMGNQNYGGFSRDEVMQYANEHNSIGNEQNNIGNYEKRGLNNKNYSQGGGVGNHTTELSNNSANHGSTGEFIPKSSNKTGFRSKAVNNNKNGPDKRLSL